MIQNNEVDISEFIKINNSGVIVASFVQIREALIKKYKETYGQDIDLSTGTADGIFINDLALIINNILQSFKNITNNLDVNVASGKYLENLCNLTNIQRKPETRSTVSIDITNSGTTSSDAFNEGELIVVDTSAVTWKNITAIPSIGAGEKISIMFECEERGQLQAPANSIYQTLDGSYTNLIISQPNDAFVGLKEETDDELRDRRSQSAGADGVTVLDSLIGALLKISGIRDVYIYNNQSSSDKVMKDNTTVLSHNIYVVLRYEEGTIVEDSDIADIIYTKLTPGISSTPFNKTGGSSGEYKEKEIKQSYLGINIEYFNEIMYWKKATPVNPKITITLLPYDNWNDIEKENIKNELVDYLNSLPLSSDLYSQQILINVGQSDPLFLGKPTYSVSSVIIEGAQNGIYTNKNTYYKYTGADDIVINTSTGVIK